MKIALVHDWLDSRVGGAEEVFLQITELYPDADIFTLLYNKSNYDQYLAGRKVKVSFLRFLPRFMRTRPILMLPFIRRAIRSYNFSDYDLIISNSSAWSKNIIVPKGVRHICYCHSPARMLWDSWPKYLDNFKIAKYGFVRFWIIWYVSKLRLWDYYATEQVDVLIANSQYIAGRIKKFYGREAAAIYPPVASPPKTFSNMEGASPYWLIISTLASYKNIDKVIEIFKATNRQLIVAGSGADAKRLTELALGYDNIKLVGRVDEPTKWQLLAGAEALILANIEDFGITPVEANAVATPVLALQGGGANESMVEGKTAIFFEDITQQAFEKALVRAQRMTWDSKRLATNAQRFSLEQFKASFKKMVSDNAK